VGDAREASRPKDFSCSGCADTGGSGGPFTPQEDAKANSTINEKTGKVGYFEFMILEVQ
jgi:hypothetical protein